ncbi:hypothetical protein LCGC14_1729950, partial [marine sediment metagenome]
MAFSYTDSGQLIGHISKTFLMINRKADALKAQGTPIDPHIMDSLSHIILAPLTLLKHIDKPEKGKDTSKDIRDYLNFWPPTIAKGV